MRTWIVGSTGLIGSALGRSIPEAVTAWRPAWESPDIPVSFRDFARSFICGASEPWVVIWAAGAANVSASCSEAEAELDAFRRCIEELRPLAGETRGTFALCSSAGAVFAGRAGGGAISDHDTPLPISPYGHLKLRQEQLLEDILGDRTSLKSFRIANAYGPGQRLHKSQGLVTRALWASVTRQPIKLVVPLETRRDYVYVDSVADTIRRETSKMGALDGLKSMIIGSGRATTISEVLRTAEHVARRRIPVAVGRDVTSDRQPRDLRFSVRKDIADTGSRVGLVDGFRRTLDDLRYRHQRGGFLT